MWAIGGQTVNVIEIAAVLSAVETAANHARLLFASSPAESLLRLLRLSLRLRSDRQSRRRQVQVGQVQEVPVLRQGLLELRLP